MHCKQVHQNVGHVYIRQSCACAAAWAHLSVIRSEYHNESRYHKQRVPHFATKFSLWLSTVVRRSTRTRRHSQFGSVCRSLGRPPPGRAPPGRPAGRPNPIRGFWPFGADDFSNCLSSVHVQSVTRASHRRIPSLPPQCSRRLRSQSVTGGLAVRQDRGRDAASYLTSIHRSFRPAKTSAPRPRPRRQRPPAEFLIKGAFHSGRQAC